MAEEQPGEQPAPELTLAQVATRVGVTPATIRRWVAKGLVPGFDGRWTASALAYVRVVARLRDRGHSLERIKQASDDGQLAIGPIENLLSSSGGHHTLRQASRATGLTMELIRQIFATMGLGAVPPEGLTDEDLELMRYAAAVLAAGFPLPAYLQLLRVYGQVMAQIADAEVRLMHLYVHKPLMRAGVPNVEIAEEMEVMAREVLPLATPFIGYLHSRLLSHFVEQDMSATWRPTSATTASRRGGCGRDRVRRPGRLRAADRRAGRCRGAQHRRAVHRGGRQHAAGRGSRDQDAGR